MIRTLGTSLSAAVASLLAASRRGVHRVTADSKRGRQMVSPTMKARSKYMPHQGAKERERAKRCYMQSFHGPMADYTPRSAAVLQQMSKRQYGAYFREVA